MPDASDMDLVREYAWHRSDAAFAELIRRHVNLVYSVGLRFTRNPPDAEDVTQAVFVILARKAAGLRPSTILTGWLYETTRFTALRWMRDQARHRGHEQEAHMQSTLENSSTDAIWQQVEPLLEQAMSRLNEKERTLLALRFFENRSSAETASIMGIGEWAAHKRTGRALEKLRKFFSARGVDSTEAAIAETISVNSIQVAPVALAEAVTAVAIAKGATASASTLTLIQGALKIMAWTKTKTVIVSGAVVLLLGAITVAFEQIYSPVGSGSESKQTHFLKSFLKTPVDNYDLVFGVVQHDCENMHPPFAATNLFAGTDFTFSGYRVRIINLVEQEQFTRLIRSKHGFLAVHGTNLEDVINFHVQGDDKSGIGGTARGVSSVGYWSLGFNQLTEDKLKIAELKKHDQNWTDLGDVNDVEALSLGLWFRTGSVEWLGHLFSAESVDRPVTRDKRGTSCIGQIILSNGLPAVIICRSPISPFWKRVVTLNYDGQAPKNALLPSWITVNETFSATHSNSYSIHLIKVALDGSSDKDVDVKQVMNANPGLTLFIKRGNKIETTQAHGVIFKKPIVGYIRQASTNRVGYLQYAPTNR
jgi:RNA polymerase sigma factor (sigma-70 family)